jgi:PAS domain-containing protein
MTAKHTHEALLEEVTREYADIFETTAQGFYIYLDDPHWVCNDRLATMLGYASPAELHSAANALEFLDVAVAQESQDRVVEAYTDSVDSKRASSIPVTWKKKGGGTLDTQTIFVPISFRGTALTIHFVTAM